MLSLKTFANFIGMKPHCNFNFNLKSFIYSKVEFFPLFFLPTYIYVFFLLG